MKRIIDKAVGDPTFRQFVKFILIGVVNTIFGYAVFSVLILLKIPPQPALAAAFFIGVIWNYWTHARIVFKRPGLNRIPAYAVSYFLIYVFNSGGLALLLKTGLGPLISQAILTPIVAVMSFVLISKALTGKYPLSRDRATTD